MNLTTAALGVALLTALVAGCSSDDTGSTSSDERSTAGAPTSAAETAPPTQPSPNATDAVGLRAAVQAYSDAFLTGDAARSYALLSARCRDRHARSEWDDILAAARQSFGEALPLKSYEEEVSGHLARVTYTYAVSQINQSDEPWVDENGWKNDDC
ncbi:hypothetical protein ACIRN4_11535 [Pimelobacter simplex]|uniref:hypothetical protein n=1 Tax=Nocardioides simplex TaxID=2045 RepID=UPI00382E5737